MKKTTLIKSVFASSIALSATFASSSFATPIVVPDAPQIAAKGYVLMDYNSGKILAEKEMNTKLSPASLTKMMTSYVIGQELERGNISLQDDVTISKNAWAKNFPDSSKMFIEVGTTVKVEELNRGIIVQSGNDACVAMAEHIAGSEDAFVDLMNAWADTLGMKDTHFANVHGLDNPNLYSTPYDMALLGQALIRDVPDEYRIYSEKKFTYNGITQYNRNGLLWDKSMNVDGIKTGHTSNAGYSLVSSATEGKMRLVAVVMGTKNANARKSESKKLLSYGFRFFETHQAFTAQQVIETPRIWGGSQELVSVGTANGVLATIPRGQSKSLKTSISYSGQLKAPLQANTVIGNVQMTLDNKLVSEQELIALETVEQGSIMQRLKDKVLLMFQDNKDDANQ